VLGFVSVYFLNNRNTAVKFAFRVHKELRGSGYGKMIQTILDKTLTSTYPQLQSSMSAIYRDGGMTKEEMKSPKLGNLLTVKAIVIYKFRCNQLVSVAKDEDTVLATLSKAQFAEVLRDSRLSPLLENNLLHMNWVPVRAQTEQDVDFAVRKRQTVMVQERGDSNVISSLSVLSHPLEVSNANTRSALDFFSEAESGRSLGAHLRAQLLNLTEVAPPHKNIIFSVIVKKELEGAVKEIFSELGLADSLLTGTDSLKGPAKNVYFYEKKIRN